MIDRFRTGTFYRQPPSAAACSGQYPTREPAASPLRSTVPAGIIITVLLSLSCTPPPAVLQKCPEPSWKRYSSLHAYQVQKEMKRLEMLLENGDTATAAGDTGSDSGDTSATRQLSGLEIRMQLFELATHHANPEYDLDRIFNLLTFLYQNGGPDSARYLNWGRAVREQRACIQQRDSLETRISTIVSGSEKRESRAVENLKKELGNAAKQRDSLSEVITGQRETIMKLQKLDVMMERQRSKIQ